MALFSRLTVEIVLPFETVGSHLDSNKKTVNEDHEKKNFQEAGKILSEVWTNAAMDGFQ